MAHCPHCLVPINPHTLKPGRFKPTCPRCSRRFLIVVPTDVGRAVATVLPPAGSSGAARTPATRPAARTVTPRPARLPRRELPPARGATQSDGPVADDDFGVSAPPGADGGSHIMPEAAPEAPPERAGLAGVGVPDRLGGYEVLKVLGKGGMGAVMLGRQLSLDRKVAIKVMHNWLSRDPGLVARFVREAYAAAQITHHNVVQIYDIGEERGTHFFSMEFVPGRSLWEEVKKTGKLDPEVAVGYVLQAARGLRYGHQQGMVHRDVKPENLLLNTEGVVKVADLGLVKLPADKLAATLGDAPAAGEADADDRLTRAGAVMGTPAYMPPEQARNSAGVDERADIYSLGCTLYVLLTGKPPFVGKSALEVISKHQTEPLVPPDAVVKRVPKALSEILLRMLAKRPEDRYRTMDQVIAALEGFLGVNRAGPFTPREEHADALEAAAARFAAASKAGLKAVIAAAFFVACVAGLIAAGAARKYVAAGGLLGLMLLTPPAYFVVSGMAGGTYLFGRARELVFGARVIDWLMWLGAAALLVAALSVFGLLVLWLGCCVVAVALAYALWVATDQAERAAQKAPLADARQLFKQMRVQGLEEEALRQFVCKYAGAHWEWFYEALFGYEAKVAARAYRKGEVTEPAKPHAAWREPVVAWIDGVVRARREVAERKHLLRVQAKALEAAGVGAAEARAEAEELAEVMVGAAAQARAAAREGRAADLRGMVRVARARKRPPAGYNIAGVPLRRGRGVDDLLNPILGRRLRFLVGAAVLGVGLFWLHQNKAELRDLRDRAQQAVAGLREGDLKTAGAAVAATAEDVGAAAPAETDPAPADDAPAPPPAAAGGVLDPQRLKPVSFLPAKVSHFGTPIAGLLLMMSGVFYFGWRPSLAAVPGCVVAVCGPMLGIPDVGPVKAWAVGTIAGAVLILVGGRLLRK